MADAKKKEEEVKASSSDIKKVEPKKINISAPSSITKEKEKPVAKVSKDKPKTEEKEVKGSKEVKAPTKKDVNRKSPCDDCSYAKGSNICKSCVNY